MPGDSLSLCHVHVILLLIPCQALIPSVNSTNPGVSLTCLRPPSGRPFLFILMVPSLRTSPRRSDPPHTSSFHRGDVAPTVENTNNFRVFRKLLGHIQLQDSWWYRLLNNVEDVGKNMEDMARFRFIKGEVVGGVFGGFPEA